MPSPSPLGNHRVIRLRVYDGTYEVLTDYKMIHTIDLGSPMLDAILAGLLVQAAEMALVLENERMKAPRLEVWCEVSGVKLRDYLGGPLL